MLTFTPRLTLRMKIQPPFSLRWASIKSRLTLLLKVSPRQDLVLMLKLKPVLNSLDTSGGALELEEHARED